jgi:hypothetical protein
MNILTIEKLAKAFKAYSKRREELDSEPTTVNIFEDKALVLHADRIHLALNEIVETPPPKDNPPNKNKNKNSKKKG